MIKRKVSICSICGNQREIYAKKMCGYCYERQRKKSSIKKPTKPIAKHSKKSLDQLRRYRKLRDIFLKENPICQFPECTSRMVTLHHARGRLGSFLTDKRYFKALCWPHHQHIEQNPDLARKLGLSISRLNNQN